MEPPTPDPPPEPIPATHDAADADADPGGGFYLLRRPADGDRAPDGPTGADDLLEHFSIRRVHDVVASRQAANYLRTAPGYPSKTGLYRSPGHSLTRLALRPGRKVDLTPFPAEFLRRSLGGLPVGRHELSEERKGEAVEMDGSMCGPPETPPGGAEGSTAKDSDRSKPPETKIKFVLAGRGDKKEGRKKAKKEKREKKEKRAHKEKARQRERGGG